jgi:hypothetical protein
MQALTKLLERFFRGQEISGSFCGFRRRSGNLEIWALSFPLEPTLAVIDREKTTSRSLIRSLRGCMPLHGLQGEYGSERFNRGLYNCFAFGYRQQVLTPFCRRRAPPNYARTQNVTPNSIPRARCGALFWFDERSLYLSTKAVCRSNAPSANRPSIGLRSTGVIFSLKKDLFPERSRGIVSPFA